MHNKNWRVSKTKISFHNVVTTFVDFQCSDSDSRPYLVPTVPIQDCNSDFNYYSVVFFCRVQYLQHGPLNRQLLITTASIQHLRCRIFNELHDKISFEKRYTLKIELPKHFAITRANLHLNKILHAQNDIHSN